MFDKIILGTLAHGVRLREDELSAEYQASRTPVREALRLLAQDGLVELVPNKGATVIGFTIDDVEEIYEIRKSLEAQALKSSVQNLSINGLKEIRDALLGSADCPDGSVHEALDARLHNYFVTGSGKRRLVSILNQMCRLIQRFRDLGYKDPVVRAAALRSHVELIDALCLRDAERALGILSDHLEESKKNALSLIMKGSWGREGAGEETVNR
jgi:DNA-binding GntR family transcriptional regulator